MQQRINLHGKNAPSPSLGSDIFPHYQVQFPRPALPRPSSPPHPGTIEASPALRWILYDAYVISIFRNKVEGSFISSFNLPTRKRTKHTRRQHHSLLPIGTRRPAVRHASNQHGLLPLPVPPRFPLFCGHHTQAAHVRVVVVTEFIPRRRSVLPLHREEEAAAFAIVVVFAIFHPNVVRRVARRREEEGDEDDDVRRRGAEEGGAMMATMTAQSHPPPPLALP